MYKQRKTLTALNNTKVEVTERMGTEELQENTELDNLPEKEFIKFTVRTI